MNALSRVCLIIAALGLGACGSNRSVPFEEPPASVPGTSSTGSDTSGIPDDASLPGGRMPGDALNQKVIYFDFDQSTIKPDYVPVVSAHARHLADNPNISVRLEGHADERGSREYNIGLGEQRSQSVRRMLRFQGLSDNQISTVSYGEERPQDRAHSDQAYAQNRRVVIVYSR